LFTLNQPYLSLFNVLNVHILQLKHLPFQLGL
jgi:hypothetical protein